MDALVVTPFPVGSMMGNSVSARRIAEILRSLGLEAQVAESYAKQDAKSLLALHARRSAPAIQAFHTTHPDRPICLLLPGSDLHRDLPDGDPTVLDTMELADLLVIAQEGSLEAIPEKFRHKTHIIPKSVNLPLTPRAAPETPISRAIILSHLRDQKDPFLAEQALRLLSEKNSIHIHHFGAEASTGFANEACARTARNPRYTWHGGVDREEAVAALITSDLLINTSKMEGGSNAIAEAITLHLPVIATSIPGNTGMLGHSHPGLFPTGDVPALAALLERASSDLSFSRSLAAASTTRAPLFTRHAETAGWKAAFHSLGILC